MSPASNLCLELTPHKGRSRNALLTPAIPDWFGGIDIYLFDQLQKDRFTPDMRVLDAGCGTGRNLVYFLRSGYEVFGVDRDATAVTCVRELLGDLSPSTPCGNFHVADIQALPFRAAEFDIVVCNAVLHFAVDESAFDTMCSELMRVLRPNAFFFARLASDIGIEQRVVSRGARRFSLPDGSERFLVNEALLLDTTAQLGGELFEPIKTVNVQGLRCMTTWCVRKTV